MTAHAPSNHPPSHGNPGIADVDASFRTVALLFFTKAALWLVVGSFLLLLASVKLHAPAMMSKAAWLTYGRLAPAGWDVLVYGFAGQAGFAVALWLLARASMQRLQVPWLVLIGGAVWNLGVLAGTVGILAGYSTGRELLEMPPGAMAFLVVGAGLIGTAGWLTFSARTESTTYPSAWFVLLSLISFVWFGSVALLMFCGDGPRGVVQVLVQRWYANGVLEIWLGGIALAAVFHALPIALGRPLASRQLALIAFWCFAFFMPWAITAHGDPFPRWIVSAGMAGHFLAAIALLAIAFNWWKTSENALGSLLASPSGRLIATAAVAYLATGLINFWTSLQSVASWTRFTWVQPGLEWLFIGGAVLAAIFALIPEILTRATGRTLSPRLTGLHALLTVIAVALIALPLIFGGLLQGAKLANPTVPFLDALRGSMHLVRLSSLGLVLFLVAQCVYVLALADVFRAMFREALVTVKSWSAPIARNRAAGVRS
jgi:cytochrome c oxidase cbb3-type subunit 1